MRRENEHLQALLRTTNDEVAELREMSEGPGPLVGVSLETDLGAQDRRSDARSDDTRPSDCGTSEGTGITTPSTSSYAHFDEDAMSYDTGSLHRFDSDRHLPVSHNEHRTAMRARLLRRQATRSPRSKKRISIRWHRVCSARNSLAMWGIYRARRCSPVYAI